MKFLLLLCFIGLFTTQCFSQIVVQIKGYDDTVYTVNPNQTDSLDELVPLEKILRDHKIIAMGEATHGTKEFFNMKAKMFKFLAMHCGYKVFSIEATYGGTLKVNDYVLYGKGDVLSAMKGMEFWTWDTEEVRELIEWMKQYNTGMGDNDKLKFYGFDCQSFKGASNYLKEYVEQIDSANVNTFLKGLSILEDSSRHFFSNKMNYGMDSTAALEISHSIKFLEKWFTENGPSYIEKGGKYKYMVARYNIENLRQALLLSQATKYKFYVQNNTRDSCMAQNVRWLSEFEKSNVFVWAHNEHIAKLPHNPKMQITNISMGEYLVRIFKSDYYNIGFVFGKGFFQAIKDNKLQECYVAGNKNHELINIFSNTGIFSFFINLQNSSNPVYNRFNRTYVYGSTFYEDKKSLSGIRPKDYFDGLIFVNSTQRAVPVRRK